MHEVGTEHPGDGEDPLGVADVGDDLVAEEGGEGGGPLGAAGGTEPAPLAREGQQVLATVRAGAGIHRVSLQRGSG
jgi:hypothetical protein